MAASFYFLGPSTLLSTIFRASAKASAGVENGIVVASLSPSSSYTGGKPPSNYWRVTARYGDYYIHIMALDQGLSRRREIVSLLRPSKT
jgi:hypothetical protein